MHRYLMASLRLRLCQEVSQRLRATTVHLNDVRHMSSEGYVGVLGVHGLSLMCRIMHSTPLAGDYGSKEKVYVSWEILHTASLP